MTYKMTELEKEMLAAGFNRSPNEWTKWYTGSSYVKGPALPMELYVTDKIWIITYRYGDFNNKIPVLAFENVAELNRYLSTNGRYFIALPSYINSID